MNKIKILIYPLVIILACSFSAFGQTASPALEILSTYPKVSDFTMTAARDEAYVLLLWSADIPVRKIAQQSKLR